jgi:enamine deaminase RidA (YjgF/YER057c/UK114 family)
MTTITRFDTNKRLSHAVVYIGTIYLTGQTASDRSQDIEGQTREVLAKIDALLAEAGSDKSRILLAQVWLKNVESEFAIMNKVWESWTAADQSTARATVQSDLAASDILVEIAVTAAVA